MKNSKLVINVSNILQWLSEYGGVELGELLAVHFVLVVDHLG